MESCLGIYLGDKLIKYAKLAQDEKTKRVSLVSHGTKYVLGDKEDTISEIITQTGSSDSALALNLTDSFRIQTEVLKQLGKADVQSVINLEVMDAASMKGVNEKLMDYRYLLMDSYVSNDNFAADIVATEKTNITKLENNPSFANLAGLYPTEYILTNIAPRISSYMLINFDETTQIISVLGGKIHKIIDLDISMKEVLNAIAEQEGSYAKACDICKGINVLSDDEGLTPELERIIEPTIQDLLNRVKTKLEQEKITYEKIYLNGLINLFINIDMLFEKFFGITTEKLKPSILRLQEGSCNIAEVIESNEAIALAYTALTGLSQDVNFVGKAPNVSNLSFKSLFNKEKKMGNVSTIGNNTSRKTFVMPSINVNFNKEKVESALMFTALTTGTIFAGYTAFSAVYNSEMTKIADKLSGEIASIESNTSLVKSDSTYIKNNTKKYTQFTDYINDTVAKIREGKIGKYTTYNVANFMQKIAKYIPENVELQTISSDDNKSVTIVAKSTSYAELGYFISQLKLQGILTNIKTGNVQTGTYITVTIGGDLP